MSKESTEGLLRNSIHRILNDNASSQDDHEEALFVAAKLYGQALLFDFNTEKLARTAKKLAATDGGFLITRRATPDETKGL